MWRLLLGLQCALLVCAQEVPEQVPRSEPEERLVRCKRPLCEMFCVFGNQLDDKGCELCECLSDPCKDINCPENQRCQSQECEDYPCHQLGLQCVPSVCEQHVCDQHCPYGFARNDHGCSICRCKEDPCEGVQCEPGNRCEGHMPPCIGDVPDCDLEPVCVPEGAPAPKTTKEPSECPMIKCGGACAFGYKKDERGCRTCECLHQPCDDRVCDDAEVCQPEEVKCVTAPCPLIPRCVPKPLCHHMRDHGMMMDTGHRMGPGRKGTPPPPPPTGGHMGGHMEGGPMGGGGGHMGDGGSMEDHMGHHMSGVARRIARAIRVARQASGDVPMMLDCDEQGNFKPLQCSPMIQECWCVDDRGLEITGTRQPLLQDVGVKPCAEEHVTKAVNVTLKLKHNLDNVDRHIENLKPVMQRHMSSLLMVQTVQINQMEISPSVTEVDILVVTFIVVQDEDEPYDLPSCMNHFTVHLMKQTIMYQEYILHPVPESVKAEHQMEVRPVMQPPKLPKEGGVRHKDYGGWSFCQNHRVAIISTLGGGVLLLFVFVIIGYAMLKKRQTANAIKKERLATFKENLAFTNDLYGKIDLNEPTDKQKFDLDPPPYDETTDSREAMA